MTDLVQRLQNACHQAAILRSSYVPSELAQQAAEQIEDLEDRVEELEAALRALLDATPRLYFADGRARRALEGKR